MRHSRPERVDLLIPKRMPLVDDLQESSITPSALNRSQSDPIENPAQEQEPRFSDQGARIPAIGIPVKRKPNQMLAGIPVVSIDSTIKKPAKHQPSHKGQNRGRW